MTEAYWQKKQPMDLAQKITETSLFPHSSVIFVFCCCATWYTCMSNPTADRVSVRKQFCNTKLLLGG